MTQGEPVSVEEARQWANAVSAWSSEDPAFNKVADALDSLAAQVENAQERVKKLEEALRRATDENSLLASIAYDKPVRELLGTGIADRAEQVIQQARAALPTQTASGEGEA